MYNVNVTAIIERELRQYCEGYLKGSEGVPDPLWWDHDVEWSLGFSRGMGDYKRGEIDLQKALAGAKQRLEIYHHGRFNR